MNSIFQNTKKLIEYQKSIEGRDKTLEDMRRILLRIKEENITENVSIEQKEIEKLLKAHKNLSIGEIIQETGFTRRIIMIVCSDLDKFEFLSNGRVALR